MSSERRRLLDAVGLAKRCSDGCFLASIVPGGTVGSAGTRIGSARLALRVASGCRSLEQRLLPSCGTGKTGGEGLCCCRAICFAQPATTTPHRPVERNRGWTASLAVSRLLRTASTAPFSPCVVLCAGQEIASNGAELRRLSQKPSETSLQRRDVPALLAPADAAAPRDSPAVRASLSCNSAECSCRGEYGSLPPRC